MANIATTPLVKQYEEMKKKHPDAILLFRVGDFYETFGEDAKIVADVCGVTLTTRNNGDGKEKIYLAGFPHHALDSYLPKIVRAGRRVAICEQLEDDKQKVVEEITPGTQSIKPKQEETKPTTPAIKEINCTFNSWQMQDLGEPVAYFSIEIPKALRHIGKLTSKERAQVSAVCLQPEIGKMIATDTHILYMADVKCSGMWPEERDGKPFECFIDPKAIAHLAGKRVDVAVWRDDYDRHVMTACEADGVLAQYQVTGQGFPDWKRVIPQNHPASINIEPSELKPLRDFLKANMGKTKKEREGRTVMIAAEKGSDVLTLDVVEDRLYSDSYKAIAETTIRLTGASDWHIRQMYRADLFYYSVQEDFCGMIFLNDMKPAKFLGEMRESVLMPMAYYEGDDKKTYCTQNPDEIK